MDIQRFRTLPPIDRALVAIAVLLDGREAATYLEADVAHGASLKRASLDLAALDPELRMTLAGTLLRTALNELKALNEGARPSGVASRRESLKQ